MSWDRPVLTDSGGYQIFSLANDRTVNERGARFRSYTDQRLHLLSPESSIGMQTAIGSDIMMVLDVCVDSRSDEATTRAAMERTHRWAVRSLVARDEPVLAATRRSEQALFAIVQGGVLPELRRESASFLAQHPFDGFALGGLAVGDTRAQREDVTNFAAELLPKGRPRYLMGVGTPPDLLVAIGAGIDMFDCILPTHLAWQGTAFTSTGRVRVSRSASAADDRPARRDVPVLDVHHDHARLPAPPLQVQRAARPAAPLAAQPVSLHGPDERGPQGHRAAALRGVRPGEARRHRPARAREAAPVSFTIVVTREGARAVLDEDTGEVMHPVVGGRVEAEALYIGPSRLRERLRARAGEGPDDPARAEPLVVLDIGLGAGSNAVAALLAAEDGGRARRVEIVSFDRTADALRLALGDAHGADFGFTAEAADAARTLLAHGRVVRGPVHWRFVPGELPGTLAALPSASADIVFWDPFSPKSNPRLWSVAAFPRRAPRLPCRSDAAHLQRSHVHPRRLAPGGVRRRHGRGERQERADHGGRARSAGPARAARPPVACALAAIVGAPSGRRPCRCRGAHRGGTSVLPGGEVNGHRQTAAASDAFTRASASPRRPPSRTSGSARGTPPRAPTRDPPRCARATRARRASAWPSA